MENATRVSMHMQYLEHEGVEWLELDLLSQFPGVQHGFFLSIGGNSLPPYDTLNLALDVGDCPKTVLQNQQKVEKAVRNRAKNDKIDCFFAKGVHGDRVALVQKGKWQNVWGADALYTREKDQALFLQQADCQVAIFYDPTTHSGAVVHAGWRGQVLDIYQKTIRTLHLDLGVLPAHLFVAIGPSLGPCCFEFCSFQENLPKEFWTFQVRPGYFDFWAIAKYQIQQAGVPPEQIQVAEICTKTDLRFFSYRRGSPTGRQAAYLLLL